jgi:hypothetical protein
LSFDLLSLLRPVCETGYRGDQNSWEKRYEDIVKRRDEKRTGTTSSMFDLKMSFGRKEDYSFPIDHYIHSFRHCRGMSSMQDNDLPFVSSPPTASFDALLHLPPSLSHYHFLQSRDADYFRFPKNIPTVRLASVFTFKT